MNRNPNHSQAVTHRKITSMIDFAYDTTNVGDGMKLLAQLAELPEAERAACIVFDPQYRAGSDHIKPRKGSKSFGRAMMSQLTDEQVMLFCEACEAAMRPNAYLLLWLDKMHLQQRTWNIWTRGCRELKYADFMVWAKEVMGLGVKLRRSAEYCVIFQKHPYANDWREHTLLDVWTERRVSVVSGAHVHAKPVGLTAELIKATTDTGDLVCDPCAGGYTTLIAAKNTGRRFIGTDLVACDMRHVVNQETLF